ncbi:transposase [Paenibacillus sp. Pae15]|uniref:transposase n=1 Tax=unclassified Paenibacillus TaxID=185978 RepID=UPI0035C6D288
MNEEISNFLNVEQENVRNSRNRYYSRTLDTRYGKIDDLQVPRDHHGEFHRVSYASVRALTTP